MTPNTASDPNAAALGVLLQQMQQLLADNQAMRRRLDELQNPAPAALVQAVNRPRFIECYAVWVRRGLEGLVASRQLCRERATFYKRCLRPLMMTRVTLPDGTRVRFGNLYWDQVVPKAGWALRSALRETICNRGAPYKDSTINGYLTCALSCLTWNIENGFNLGRNPLRGVKIVNDKASRRKTRWTFQEWQTFLSHTPPLVQDIGIVQWRTNMRPTETRLLMKREWHPEAMKIELTERPGCKTGARPIVVTPDVAEILNRRAAESKGPYIFVDARCPRKFTPLPQRFVNRWFRRAAKVTGMKGFADEAIVPYVGRHGGLNDALQAAAAAGIGIGDIAVHSGNSVKTIMEYYHKYESDPQAQERLRLALEAAIAARAAAGQAPIIPIVSAPIAAPAKAVRYRTSASSMKRKTA